MSTLHIGENYYIRTDNFAYPSTEFTEFCAKYPVIDKSIASMNRAVTDLVTASITDSETGISKRAYLSTGFGFSSIESDNEDMYTVVGSSSDTAGTLAVVDFSVLLPYNKDCTESIIPFDYDWLGDNRETLIGQDGNTNTYTLTPQDGDYIGTLYVDNEGVEREVKVSELTSIHVAEDDGSTLFTRCDGRTTPTFVSLKDGRYFVANGTEINLVGNGNLTTRIRNDITTETEQYYWYTLSEEGDVSFSQPLDGGVFATQDGTFNPDSSNAFKCKTYRLVISERPLTLDFLAEFVDTYVYAPDSGEEEEEEEEITEVEEDVEPTA